MSSLVVLSAVTAFLIYGYLSLIDPAGRFAAPDPLAFAGRLEASRTWSLAIMLLVALVSRNLAVIRLAAKS